MVRARRVERIGRYGAIGLPTEDQIDTEGLENATIAAIDGTCWQRFVARALKRPRPSMRGRSGLR